MKPFEILTTVLLTGTMTFTGCSRQEEPDHFRYTVNDYPLQQGFMNDYGMTQGTTGYNFDVIIHSPGVSYNHDRHEFQGTGHVVYFQMFSSSATELANGTYQFSTGKASGAPSTFNVANFGMNVNFTEDTGTIVSGVSGVVKVSGAGDYRTIDFDCMTTTGENVAGHFNGYIPAYKVQYSLKYDLTNNSSD